MATNINTNTALVQVDVQTTTKTVTLPQASLYGGRLITIKDKYGTCSNYNITIQTLGGDTIDGAGGSYVLSNNGAAVSLVSDGSSRWMTLNSPSQPFTGSTIALSSATTTVSSLGLFDPYTSQLSNIQMSSGRLLVGGEELGGGQTLLVSTNILNFFQAFGSNITVGGINASSGNISTVLTSNLQAYFGSISTLNANMVYGGMFFGDGSHLSNLIPASTTVVTPQYALFTVSSGTSYTGEPWTTQPMILSSLATQISPLYLDTDGYVLRFTNEDPRMFRVSYMTGGNQDTLTTSRPTITLAKIVDSNTYYYPSVENFEGGGGSVTFMDFYNSTTQLVFGMRGLSNYTFTDADSYLYRMTFETVSGTTSDIFSTINYWTNYNRFASTVDFDSQIRVQNILASNVDIQGPLSINGDVTALSNVTTTLSSIADAMHTNYLRVMSNAIIGSNSISMSNNNISAANITVSSIALFDQSTSTYKALIISSGSIYLGGTLASAGGSGGGVGGSTLSSLFVGSSSNQNFIKFWGRQGEYNNAAIVEQSTGGVTGEMLTFKGSSVNDQIRFQTTGGIRFETGVSQPRDVNSASQLATPSMIINSSSNVGILTNNPTYTLDVTGTGRFTTLMSTTNLYAGAFYMGLYFA
jgi:hypothetical protein